MIFHNLPALILLAIAVLTQMFLKVRKNYSFSVLVSDKLLFESLIHGAGWAAVGQCRDAANGRRGELGDVIF